MAAPACAGALAGKVELIRFGLSACNAQAGELFVERGRKFSHLFLERNTIILDLGRTYVSARGQHVTVLPDFFQAGGFAEAGDVLVGAGLKPAPTSGPADIPFTAGVGGHGAVAVLFFHLIPLFIV